MSNRLLSPVATKPKGVQTIDYYETRKPVFFQMMNYKMLFKGHDVEFLYAKEPERCYQKFMCGDEKNPHRTIDNQRVERFQWIHEILDHLCSCNRCDDCKNIHVFLNEEDRRYYIIDNDNSYLIVLSKKESSYLLLSAFRMNKKVKQKNLLKLVKYGDQR